MKNPGLVVSRTRNAVPMRIMIQPMVRLICSAM